MPPAPFQEKGVIPLCNHVAQFKWKKLLPLLLAFTLCLGACFRPAYAADSSSGDEVFLIDDEPVPLAESIWGSEPASVYITREFYKGTNTIEVPMAYFTAIEGDQSVSDKAVSAFWEAQRQSCYLFGDAGVSVSVGNNVTITRAPYFDSSTEQTMREAVNAEADRILSRIISDGMSDYQKAYAIYQFVSGAAYDWTAYNAITGGGCYNNVDKWAKAISAYGNLIERKSVCQGDAQAFNVLARKAGLTSMTATGKMSSGGGHAWNRVWCGSQWYEVDCCFGYFCSSFRTYSASTGVIYGGVGIIEGNTEEFYGS